MAAILSWLQCVKVYFTLLPFLCTNQVYSCKVGHYHDRSLGVFVVRQQTHQQHGITGLTTSLPLTNIVCLTHCGLMTPFGDIDLDQQGMTCMTSPSYYLNQYWLIIKGILLFLLRAISQWELMYLIHTYMCSKITLLKLLPHLPGVNQ